MIRYIKEIRVKNWAKVVCGLLLFASPVQALQCPTAQTASLLAKNSEKTPAQREAILKERFDSLKGNRCDRVFVLRALIQSLAEQQKKTIVAKLYPSIVDSLSTLPRSRRDAFRNDFAKLLLYNELYKETISLLSGEDSPSDKEKATMSALLGRAHFHLQHYSQAQSYLEQAIRSKKRKIDWKRLLASVYARQKRYRKEAQIRKNILSYDPENVSDIKLLADAYARATDYGKALAVLEIAHAKGILREKSEILYLAHLYYLDTQGFRAYETLVEGIQQRQIKPTGKILLRQGHYLLAAKETSMAREILTRAASYKEVRDEAKKLLRYLNAITTR